MTGVQTCALPILGIEPTARVVVTEADHLRYRDGLGLTRDLVHAPKHKPAGLGRSDVQVIAFGIVAEQVGPKTGVHPQRQIGVLPQRSGLGAPSPFVSDHIVQDPAVRLPTRHRACDGFAAQDHGNIKSGRHAGIISQHTSPV